MVGLLDVCDCGVGEGEACADGHVEVGRSWRMRDWGRAG
jgi:hypothetical protein